MTSRYNIKNAGNINTFVYFRPTESTHLDDIQLLLEDQVQEGSYNAYKEVKNYVERLVNSEFFCKGLNPGYITHSFDEVDAVVLISSSANVLPNGNVFGFALVVFDERHNALYIDVICTHAGIQGAGDFMMKTIEEMARKLMISKIYLKSVKSAVSFYEKYGFVKREHAFGGVGHPDRREEYRGDMLGGWEFC